MQVGLFDSHCHLAAEDFEQDLKAIVERARGEGVQHIMVVGTDAPSSRQSLKVAQKFPGFFASAGVHPHDSAGVKESSAWREIEELAAEDGFQAIGETGLDYHYDHSPREVQREILGRHVALARSTGKPLILHCRESYADLLDVLDQEGGEEPGGVIHCFTGTAAQAAPFLERGYHISFSGIVTFKKAEELREAAKTVPTDRLLIETDAPYLAPMPHRGKRNEPGFVRHTLEKLAEVRGEGVSKLAGATTANALRLFGGK